MLKGRPVLAGLISLLIGAAIWLPSFHRFMTEPAERFFSKTGLPPLVRAVSGRHIRIWTEEKLRSQEIERMRGRNAEWDFMARCFFVWSLGNMAMRDPGMKATCLQVMDRIIDETVHLEEKNGMFFFLMDYARNMKFRQDPARSQFIDGEIALMLGIRRMVEEKDSYRDMLLKRVGIMTGRMEKSPVLSAESYPDECWLFCNTISLAAIKVSDFLDGTDHSDFFGRWIATARQKLLDPKTGILVSSYNLNGDVIMDGPEGSSIWMAVHCLRIIDPAFAEEQYKLARTHLRVDLAGFSYCYEWPRACLGMSDVDSGPIIPILDLSAGSTGLAFVGAATFGDLEFLGNLFKSLNLGGFPVWEGDQVRYCGSNAVGDAVMLYAMALGPAWDRILEGAKK